MIIILNGMRQNLSEVFIYILLIFYCVCLFEFPHFEKCLCVSFILDCFIVEFLKLSADPG